MMTNRKTMQSFKRREVTASLVGILAGLAGCTGDRKPRGENQEALTSTGSSPGTASPSPTATTTPKPQLGSWRFIYADQSESNYADVEVPTEDLSTRWSTSDSSHGSSYKRPAQFNSEQIFISKDGTIQSFSHDGEREFSKDVDSIGEFFVRTEGLALQTKNKILGLDGKGERTFFEEFPGEARFENTWMDFEPHPEPGKQVFVLSEKEETDGYHPKNQVSVGVVNTSDSEIEWKITHDWTAEKADVSDSYGRPFAATEYEISKTLINPAGTTLVYAVNLDNGETEDTEWDKVRAVNLTSGEVKWEVQARSRFPYAMTNDHVLVADFKPFDYTKARKIQGWHVISMSDGSESSLDVSGEKLPLGNTPSESRTTDVFHPALVNTTVFIPKGDALVAVDISTGKVKWEYLSTNRITSPPTVARNAVVFGTDNGIEIVSRNGKQLNSVDIGEAITEPVTLSRESLYAVGKNLHSIGIPESTTTDDQ